MRAGTFVVVFAISGCAAAPVATVEPAPTTYSAPAPTFAERDDSELREAVDDIPGWALHRSLHFTVIYHDVEWSVAITIARVAEELTLELWFATPREVKLRTPLIRCVRDLDIFLACGGPRGTTGYWSPLLNEIVVIKHQDGAEATAADVAELLRRWYERTAPEHVDSIRALLTED